MMGDDDIYKEIDKYGSLLKKLNEGKLTKEEREELAKWLWKERANRELLQEIRSMRSFREYYEQASVIDAIHEFRLLVERYPQVNSCKRKIVPVWRYVVAATVACLFMLGGWLLFYEPKVQEMVLTGVPSRVQAILTTAGGEVIPIRKGKNESQIASTGSFELQDSVMELICTGGANEKLSVGFHKLEVPRGGEYNLVLPDGTHVRLNSESTIRFPERFDGKYREIEVSGEVYLKVAKDARRPFVVCAGEYRTEVLGTHFGMRVFPEEAEWTTVLEEGKVKVSYRAEQIILMPGEKAYLDHQELKRCSVDVGKEIAWVSGLFVFEHDRLERVVNELSRWYNVQFRFEQEELKDHRFTGKVSRDIGVNEILSLISRMNVVTFDQKDGYILIRKNDKVDKYN